jgi:predicted metal-dependent hydrolase
MSFVDGFPRQAGIHQRKHAFLQAFLEAAGDGITSSMLLIRSDAFRQKAAIQEYPPSLRRST